MQLKVLRRNSNINIKGPLVCDLNGDSWDEHYINMKIENYKKKTRMKNHFGKKIAIIILKLGMQKQS